MIPKKIHYCWFGGVIPEVQKKYIESWEKYCPDYQIIRWDESNFDVNCNAFVKAAYEAKKWAFVSDYARLWIIYHYGGFYLDTDVELLRSLEGLRADLLYFGCEGKDNVASGLGFGAEPGVEFLRENMKIYETMNPFDEKGEFFVKPCPFYTTQLLKEQGLKTPVKRPIVLANGIKIYSNEYFNPYDWASRKTKITKNTYSIHHYAASWMTEEVWRFNINQHNYKKIEQKYGKLAATIYDFYFWSKKENGGAGLYAGMCGRLKKERK